MTRCWVCNEEFGMDGVHICANTPFKIKPAVEPMSYMEVATLRSILHAFGPDEAVTLNRFTWSRVHAAISRLIASPPPPAEPAPVPLLSDEKLKAEINAAMGDLFSASGNSAERVVQALEHAIEQLVRNVEKAHGIGGES